MSFLCDCHVHHLEAAILSANPTNINCLKSGECVLFNIAR